jgi:hypothetical protein
MRTDSILPSENQDQVTRFFNDIGKTVYFHKRSKDIVLQNLDLMVLHGTF